MMLWCGAVVGAVLITMLYHLHVVFTIISLVMVLGALPVLIKYNSEQKYQEKRMIEVSTYIETMLYAFKRKPKILDALKDTGVLFEKGDMKQAIDKAINFMEVEYYEGNREEKALESILDKFPNSLIEQMHQYFIKVEEIGGEYGIAIDALLAEKNMWIDRSMEYKKECQKWKRNINIGIMLSLGICICILYFLPQNINIMDHILYQLGTVVSYAFYILIFLNVQKRLAIDYVTTNRIDEKRLLNCYDRVRNYNNKKERNKSICFSIIPLIGILVSVACKNLFSGILFTVLCMITMCQHRIGYYLNQKTVTTAMVQSFPQWLLEIALLMQTENVQTAIAKSKDRAPLILQPEIDGLIQELIVHPEGIEPYINFLKKYQNMEILSAMKILYSISTNSTGNVQKQIEEVLNRSNRLRNDVEVQKNEQYLAGMNVLFLMPIMVAGAKMLVDMTLFLIVFLQQASI